MVFSSASSRHEISFSRLDIIVMRLACNRFKAIRWLTLKAVMLHKREWRKAQTLSMMSRSERSDLVMDKVEKKNLMEAARGNAVAGA